MNNRQAYIMQEQVHNLVPSLMSSELYQQQDLPKPSLHIVSIAVVSVVYLLAMALTS